MPLLPSPTLTERLLSAPAVAPVPGEAVRDEDWSRRLDALPWT